VETHGSPGGRFLVHYTRDGINAVPDDDDDTSGVPDFVEEVALTYDEVLATYEELGFRAPLDDGEVDDNGGDDRFDVYLVDFAGVGDGAYRDDACDGDRCAGFMTQENDFAGYGYPSRTVAIRILSSHEFFHAVQSAYDNGQGSVLAEGSAVWATEVFDGSLGDFEAFLPGYLENPDRPIDEPLPGPVDPFSYGSAIFFQYLAEAHGEDVIASLLESTEDGAGGVDDPYWVDQLDPVLGETGSSFAEAFIEFATWNLYTDEAADPSRSYADGDGYPRVRIDPEVMPHVDERLRLYRASAQYIGASPGDRQQVTAAVVPTALAPDGADGVSLILATEVDGAIVQAIELEDVTAGTEVIDTSDVDRVIVGVVNTATTGDSRRPALCVGSAEEVAACIATYADPGTGSGGAGATGATTSVTAAGSGGADGSGDGSGGSAVPEGDGDEEEGCGCEVPGAPASRAPASALAVAAIAAAAGYRRRRRAASSPASATSTLAKAPRAG
jgi:MYXO-CTERM domain-containing protein